MTREEAKEMVVDRVRRLDTTSRTPEAISGYKMGMIYALKHAGVIPTKDREFLKEVNAEIKRRTAR